MTSWTWEGWPKWCIIATHCSGRVIHYQVSRDNKTQVEATGYIKKLSAVCNYIERWLRA